jgi:hypothetical protein
MVEIYFQCQSDNGTLQDGMAINPDEIEIPQLTAKQVMPSDNGAYDTLRVSTD